MALVYKQPGLLNCWMHHSGKDTHRSQVLCTQKEICKAPRQWRRRGGVNEIEALEKRKFISPKLQDWSSAMEGIQGPGKPRCCHRKALWDCLSTVPDILSSYTPCSPQAQNYLENSLSLLQSALSSNINQPRLCYRTQIKCGQNLGLWRAGGGTAQSREEFIFFFHCVRMNPLKRRRCSFNNKK